MISVFCVLGLNWILCIYIHLHNVFLFLSQDYKTYLDFVLALENRKEPAALQYIFKLLDMENRGYLNVFSLNYFFRVSIAHASHKHALMTEYLICIYSLHLHHQFLILAPDHISQDVASLFCFVFLLFLGIYINLHLLQKHLHTLCIFSIFHNNFVLQAIQEQMKIHGQEPVSFQDVKVYCTQTQTHTRFRTKTGTSGQCFSVMLPYTTVCTQSNPALNMKVLQCDWCFEYFQFIFQ